MAMAANRPVKEQEARWESSLLFGAAKRYIVRISTKVVAPQL